MSFMDAEVSQPYKSLMYSYPEESARLDTDAMNRARQFSAQSAAARGSGGSARGPALNSYNRIMSDYTTNKAQTDRADRLAYTNSQANVMRSPGAITPSTLSTLGNIGGTIGGSLLKEAAPDIYKKMKWWDAKPQDLAAQYNAIGGQGVVPSSGMDTSQFGYSSPLSQSVQDYAPAYSSLTSGYGADYGSPSAGEGPGYGFGGFDGGYGDVMGGVGSAIDYSPYVSAATDYSPYVSAADEGFSLGDLFDW